MCGIIGYIGHKKASPILINGLLRLEYRGYDSAGISTIEKNGLSVMKDVGRVKNLYNLKGINSLEGTIGIAHTRWATHGKPSKENAHPHLDNSNSFAVVHNGIIENYNELKKFLLDNGYTFHSQTDTEIIPNLIHYYYSKDKKDDDKKVLRAVQKTCKDLKGSYALQIISKYMPDNMIVIRKDSPLVIGKGDGENYISSDIPAILSFTKDFYLLNDNVYIVACGTAMHAGLSGKNAIENLCHIPVTVDIASEFRYRNPIIDKNTLCIYISQSGETADTIAALKLAKSKGATTLAISNVIGSSITREADYSIYTHAGPEIAVASTKAYTSQVMLLVILAIYFAEILESTPLSDLKDLKKEIFNVPEKIEDALKCSNEIKNFAKNIYQEKDVFFLGRGVDYNTALEASLKLKEISYIHSEAYAAGELKHGPIALIENGISVISIITNKNLVEKTISNIQEVITRGAKTLVITNQQLPSNNIDTIIEIPNTNTLLSPIVSIIPLQLLSYYISKEKGLDVDKPRNLAKSVTVE